MLTRAAALSTFLAFAFLLIPTHAIAAPSITSISPTSGGVGTSVTITGSGFGTSQGTNTVKFSGTTATTITLWSATSIKAAVPTGATTGNVVVTVGGVASNGKPFTVTAPSITSLSPITGGAGTSVTITGTGFGTSQSTSSVQFNGTTGTTFTLWSPTSIKVAVPTGATTGNVVVTVGGMASAGKPFTVTAPSITSLSPTSGAVGTSVTITGTGFGTTQGSSTVQFNGTSATTITSWSATSINASVPTGATTGNVVTTVGGLVSNGKSFTVKPTPSIASLSPSFGAVGLSVTISGANFGTTQGTSTVKFNGVTATPTSWGASQIIVPVPSGASTGNVVVNTSGVNTNGINFTVLSISSISVTPANLSLPLNSVQQYTATAIYSNNSTQNLGANVTWSSSNPSVATINTTGVLSAVAQGPATIQGSFGSFNGATSLTVKAASFIPVGDLNQARWRHTATLLPNGNVLVVGGGSQTDFLTSAELFDPVTKTFAFTNGDLGTSRWGHSATLLQNGKVLIVGGDTLIAGNSVALATAEIYDPQTGLFSPTGSLHSARALHTATLLNSGKVLIGGPGTIELYDPASGTFSDTGILLPGQNGTATLLNNGTVLIAGGLDHNSNVIAATDIYDPVTGTLASVGNLNIASAAHTGTLLNNGQVLIAAGESTSLGAPLARAELYDPTGKTFAQTASLAVPRGSQTATLLNDGTVLVVGGGNLTSVFGSAELFDPSTHVFIGAGALANPRSAHTETLLQDGTVLVTGGSGLNGVILASAELYAPPLPPPSSLQITPAITSIVIGQTKQFKVFDDLGRQRFDVVWTVSNSTIAPITPGDMPTLSALAAGQVILTANVQGVTAQLQITIAPSSLQVTPATVNLQVGDTRQFTVVDNLGHPSGDVTWAVSDTSLATITTGNQPTLTAVAAGQVTVTATVEGVISQAHVSVSTGMLAPGAVLWSSPPVSGFVPLQLTQAVPTNTGPGPDLYSVQASADGTKSIVQGLTADGQQQWQTSLPIVNGNSVPDGSGGLLVTEHNTCLPGQTDPMTIVDLDGTTGQPTVMAVAAGIQTGNGISYCYPDDVKWVEPQFAIRTDGSVVIAAMTNNGLSPLTVNGLSISIDPSTSTDSSGRQFADFSPMGPPIVNSDGSTYVEYEVRQIAYPPRITSAILYLLQIAPDNSLTRMVLSSVTTDTNLFPGRIISDGQGGVLATWTIAPSNPPSPTHPYQASHVVAGVPGTPYELPFTPTTITFGKYPTLILGESGTAFATDGLDPDNGPQIVSFEVNAGSVHWSYQASTQSTLSLIASAAGNGLAAKITQNGTDTVLRFDSTGSLATDPLAGNGIDYFTSDLWTGVDSAITEYTAAPVVSSTSDWFQPNQGGTNKAVQHLTVTGPSTTGTNQTSIVSAFRGIKTILEADAKSQAPKYTDCSTWLGTQALPLIQLFLTGDDGHSYNVGHAQFLWDSVPPVSAANIGAFTGKSNKDGTTIAGLPANGFGMTVNDGGAFFNATDAAGKPWVVGPRQYPGNTLRAQAAALVHELSHALSDGNAGSAGFQHDMGDTKAIKANDKLVDQHCRRPIEDLDAWFWIETPWLPPGVVGTAYSATLTARGGVTPYAWSITQGALPPGLALNSATGAITGTPTAHGTASFTVQVVDATTAPNTRTTTETYSIAIP